jgi:apolipoprotein N-acyltransferase
MALAEPPVRNVQSESDRQPTRIGTTSLSLGVGLSIASGLLAVWSFEDFHIEWLIWVAFVPAIVAQHRVLPARWSGLGLGMAVGIMFQGYLGPGLGGADLAWFLYVYGVWIGIFVAVLAWRSRRFHARTGYRWLPLTAPMVWVALDFLRTGMTEVFAGSWGMVAYAMYDRPALLQPVSITGIHGLNLLILMVNWTLGLGVLAALDHRHGPPPDRAAISLGHAHRWRIRVAAVIGVWVVVSVALLGQAMGPAVRVAAIQPDPYSPQPRTVDIDQAEELRRDLEQSRHAADLGAELIVWHEAGLEFDPRGADGAPIAAFADAHDVYLAVGWQTPTENGRFNEVASFGPDGEVLGSYGKSHPGEFAGDYSERQGEYLVYETPFGAFGSIICFDLDFLDSARNVARLGARILAVSSNDVAGIAEKHYTHLVFRAIETRLAAVKADSAYDSAIIDPHGRILARHVDKQTSRATVVADVPIGTGDTIYVRYGDWLAWLAVAGTIVLAVFGAFVRRRSLKEPA